jgi:hypothetical protein
MTGVFLSESSKKLPVAGAARNLGKRFSRLRRAGGKVENLTAPA